VSRNISNKTSSRLGRGLESLIPTELDEFISDSLPKELTHQGATIAEIKVEAISANPHQPRDKFDQEALRELAESIKAHGVIQPVILIDQGEGKYQLVAGERRLRAAKIAKLKTLPAIVRTFSQQQQLELALIENIQRAELSVMEEAAAYRKLADQFNLSYVDLGKRVGKAPQTVINLVRLLKLPAEAKEALNKHLIVEGHARCLLTLGDDLPSQQHMLSMIIRKNLTVRQAEELARNYKTDSVVDEKKVIHGTPAERKITSDLGKFFNTKVRLQKMGTGGRLVIDYNSDKKLENIAKRILE